MVTNSKAGKRFNLPLCMALLLATLLSSLLGFFSPKHALATGTMIVPTEGTITQYFLDQTVPDETGGSYYDYNDQLVTLPKNSKFAWHDGVDIAASGTDCTKQQGPVYAAGAGTVIFAGYQTGFGWSVEIDHGQSVSSNGKYVFTLYGHMGTADVKNKPGTSCLAVTNGQKVTAGQLIGYQGRSGNATGVHLHWSVKVNPTADSWKGSIYASPDFYTGLHLTIGNTPLLTSLAGHFQISPSRVSVTTTSGQNPSPQTLTMTNGGNGPLTWNLTSSLPSWLAVSPISGSLVQNASQKITLTFSLPATLGTYSTTLVFSDSNADNSPASVPLMAAVVEFISEFPTPTTGSNPFGITTGPDGNLWFTEDSGNNIGKITTSGTITEFPIPTANSAPFGITAGPDGNLWFVEFRGDKIGKITTSGTITEFPLPPTPPPNTISAPYGITTGPDGNLWFTESVANQIGRITPSGIITEFPIPTPMSDPYGITTGPDGNLWFVEGNGGNGNKIGKITTSGTITEYPLPGTIDDALTGITTGPDGNLWFTETGGNNIGKITTSGTVTEYPIPTNNSWPYGITTGPDGNLWFTESVANQIGRITTSGTVTEYPISTSSSSPRWITTGPDSNLWFTEIDGNKIGRVNLSQV